MKGVKWFRPVMCLTRWSVTNSVGLSVVKRRVHLFFFSVVVCVLVHVCVLIILEWLYGWMDGWINEWMDGWMHEWIDWLWRWNRMVVLLRTSPLKRARRTAWNYWSNTKRMSTRPARWVLHIFVLVVHELEIRKIQRHFVLCVFYLIISYCFFNT